MLLNSIIIINTKDNNRIKNFVNSNSEFQREIQMLNKKLNM